MKLGFLIMAFCAGGLFAQQFSAGAVLEPSSFSSKDSLISVSSYSFSGALLSHFEISTDTDCPQLPYSALDKSGFTRTELTAAAIISKEKGVSLCLTLKDFRKEKSFTKIAKKNGFEPLELFSRASKTKEEIEKKAGDEIEEMRKVWLSTQPYSDNYEE